jgi:hypothetical protein
MKLKDFFSKRGTQAKIEDEAFKKFIETVPDFEVPEEIDATLETHFMTADKAITDKAIMNKARAEVYNIVDERITAVIPEIKKIDGGLVVDIETERDTLKKLTKLGQAVGKASEKLKTAGGQESEKIEEYKKEQEKLLKRISDNQSEWTTKETELKKNFDDEKKTLILDHALKQKIAKIEYADEHKELRGAIDDVVFHSLKKDNHLSLNESGDFVVSIMENGIPKPKFNGNTQVTFDQVLEEKVKPYVKKNNGGGKDKETPKHKKEVPPTTGLTLAQQRAAQRTT